jgi:hypothetical protein
MSDLPPPVHRQEDVQVTNDAGAVAEARVVQDVGAEQRQTAAWANGFVWLIFGVVIGLLALRFGLKLIGANPGAGFAQLIYGVTDMLLLPFFGLTITPALGAMVLEIHTLIAMVVYALVAWLITRLVSLLLYRPAARTVSRQETIYPHRH